MTLKHLKVFTEVCKYESMTLAAENLNIAQPAVSMAIRELESFYGIKLFERMNRKLYITDSGRHLLEYASTILTQFNESINTLRNSEYLLRLRIGASVAVGSTLLSSLLSEFKRLNSEVSVFSIIDNSKIIEEMLLKNQIDLAITDSVSPSPYLESEIVYKEKMLVVCGPEYKIGNSLTINELASEKLIVREKGSGTRFCIDSVFSEHGLTPNIIMESSDTITLIKAAAHNLGITFVSGQLVEDELQSGTLKEIKIKDSKFGRAYYLVNHKNKYLTKAMDLFISVVKKQ